MTLISWPETTPEPQVKAFNALAGAMAAADALGRATARYEDALAAHYAAVEAYRERRDEHLLAALNATFEAMEAADDAFRTARLRALDAAADAQGTLVRLLW